MADIPPRPRASGEYAGGSAANVVATGPSRGPPPLATNEESGHACRSACNAGRIGANGRVIPGVRRPANAGGCQQAVTNVPWAPPTSLASVVPPDPAAGT